MDCFDKKRYGQFLDYAVVDGRNRLITFNLNSEKLVTTTLPHFWDYAGTSN